MPRIKMKIFGKGTNSTCTLGDWAVVNYRSYDQDDAPDDENGNVQMKT